MRRLPSLVVIGALFLPLILLYVARFVRVENGILLLNADIPPDALDSFFADLAGGGLRSQVIIVVELLPIILIAGASEVIGQTYVLLANRVRPFRLILTLVINVVIFFLGYFVTVFSVWLIGRYILGYDFAVQRGLIAVGVSYLPLWFGFLAALPYLGSYIMYVLYFFVYVNLAQSLVNFGYTSLDAVISTALSLIIVYVMRATVGRPVIWVVDAIRNAVAGTQLAKTVDEVLLQYEDYFIDPDGENRKQDL